MEAKTQTIQQIERALRKVAAKYPQGADPVLTDIHLEVKPESGELLAYNDDDQELTRCVVEEWIASPIEDFYEQVSPILRQCINKMRGELDHMSILRPYSFVLVDEEHETLSDLVLIDNEETIILDGELLQGLEEDLDAFLRELMK